MVRMEYPKSPLNEHLPPLCLDMFRHNTNAMIFFTRHQKIVEANACMAQISGYSLKTLSQMDLGDLFSSDDTDKINACLMKSQALSRGHITKVFFQTSPGRSLPVAMNITSLPDYICEGTLWHAQINDLSEPRRMSQKLKRAQERHLYLARNIDAGISRWSFGPTGRYIEINPAMSTLLGYTPEELYKTSLPFLHKNETGGPGPDG